MAKGVTRTFQIPVIVVRDVGVPNHLFGKPMRWVETRKTIGREMKSGPHPGGVWNSWNNGFKHFDVWLVILVANNYVGDNPNSPLARLPSSFKCYQELSQYHLDLTRWHLCCKSIFPIISETIVSVAIISQSNDHHLSSCWPITGLSPCTGATALSTIYRSPCWPAHQLNLVNVHFSGSNGGPNLHFTHTCIYQVRMAS